MLLKELLNNSALLEKDNQEIVKKVQEKLDLVKKSTLDSLENLKKDTSVEAKIAFTNSIYPKEHKLHQLQLEDTIKLIKSIQLEDLRSVYKQIYNPHEAKITVVGNLTRSDIDNSLIPVLDDLATKNQNLRIAPDYSKMATVESAPTKLTIVNSKDNKPESQVLIGNSSELEVDSPEYYPSMLANMILGGSIPSRLFADVRERLGLVYGINSNVRAFRKGSGPFQISLACDPRNLKKTIAATCSCVKTFLEEGVSPEELELAKMDLKKLFAMNSFESRVASVNTLSGLMLRGKDESFVNNFSSMIDAITVDQVNAAAKKFIKPKNFSIVATKPKDFVVPADKTEAKPKTSKVNMAIAA